MGLNEINDWILGLGFGAISINTVLSVFNLFKGIFGSRRISKLMNFTAVADMNIKDNQVSFATLKKDLLQDLTGVLEKVKNELINPLVNRLAVSEKNNVMLSDITVTLLSLVNVPLDQKRELFSALSGISTISNQAKELLSASIKSEEAQQVATQTNDNLISENISKS
jgi:hypothetical protein